MLPATAHAAGAGTWGPDATPYRNGVVCTGGSVATALVSWDGQDGGVGFGLSPIQSGYGHTDEPATSGIAIPVQPSQSGVDSTTIAQLAYLISTHGDDGSAGVVADVAADVLTLTGTRTGSVDACVAQGLDGTSATEANRLLDEAGKLAGPYSVDLSGPSTATAAGKPVPLVARVTSAAGYPVPNLAVSFSPSGTGTRLSAASATTDANGEAEVVARTGGAAATSAASAAVTATVQAPVGLVETTSGGNVPVAEAAAPQHYSDRLALSVDTRPDPQLQLTDADSLLLTGGELGQTLTVTGMNGHAGAATVSLYGPLALGGTGCAAHTAADWAAARAARTVAEAPQVTVTGDGSYPVRDATQLSPGCYQAVAQLRTTDATPNVTARATGAVVTVAPVSIAAAAGHGGIAPVGGLQTVLRATGPLPATWADVRGEVVGPRTATGGTCPTSGWSAAPTAASVTSASASTDSASDVPVGTSASDVPVGTSDAVGAGSSGPSPASGDASRVAAATVTSTAVSGAGCYAFRLTATLQLPGIGSTTISLDPGTRNAPVHVIAPAVSVTGLSGSGVASGGHLAADVAVTSSDGQPGSLRLELLRLPYTFRGCFDADWSRATVVDAHAPALSTSGDNTYRVSTAAVPGSACWTVVPVFTASANPAVRAQSAPGIDPMLAFTSTVRPRSDRLVSADRPVTDGTTREIASGAAAAAVLLGMLLATLIAARAGRRRAPIDPRDQLLG